MVNNLDQVKNLQIIKTPARPQLAFKLLSPPLFIKMLRSPGLSLR